MEYVFIKSDSDRAVHQYMNDTDINAPTEPDI